MLEDKKIGTKIDDIPVKISYRIIELFSAGLYSSPNKAFEELVSNSYDAYAKQVAVNIPSNVTEDKSHIWVCDNGLSMTKDGLKDLWKIGESNKRQGEDGDRLQIGRFGIGKLATYILTHKLTYLCKTKEGYFLVTMDYSEIKKDTENLNLDELKLEESEAKTLVESYTKKDGKSLVPFELFGENAEKTWTFTLLTSLKPKVSEIKEGRLKWILRTALPLNPDFKLFYNGAEIKSSKEKLEPWKIWVFGKEDKIAKKNDEITAREEDGKFFIDMPNIKGIQGQIDLYRDSLLTGAKSERLGRSHGFFVMVRKRLINLDDPLFGMDALSHGVFNRIRSEVHADGLDDYITSTRESIKDVSAKKDLETYLKKKFAEVREWYFNQVEEEELQNRASYKVSHSASSYTRKPILSAAKRFFNGEITDLVLTDLPKNLNEDEKKSFIEKLEADLTSEEGIIKDVVWATLSPEEPLAKLNLEAGVAKINSMHPFFANFIEEVRSVLPFKLIAITEVLTEVSLIEQGIDEFNVREIMNRRDHILRELTFSDKPNAPLVATLLKATVSDPDGLEDSLAKAFSSIGFETTPIGGNGKPDGKAVAYLENKKSDLNFSLTYDAKSTKKERIMASTAHISGVDRHRKDYEANFAVVVAIDFQGANDPNSAVNKEAKNLKVSLIKVEDLAKLVLLSGPKQLGLSELRDFFENCQTVIETTEWINNLSSREIEKGPIKEILEATYEIIKDDVDKPNITSIKYVIRGKYPEYKDISSDTIKRILHSLETIVPNYVSLNGDDFSIQNTPEIILRAINNISVDDNVPLEYRDAFLKAYTGDTEES